MQTLLTASSNAVPSKLEISESGGMISNFEVAPSPLALASFNVEIRGIVLRGVTLRTRGDGKLAISPPKFCGKAAYVVPPDLWEKAEDAAIKRYRRHLRSLSNTGAVSGGPPSDGSVAIDLA